MCAAHYRRSIRHANPTAGNPSLTLEQIQFIRQNCGVISPDELATRLNTDAHTVIAVQAGRNWGRVHKAPQT